MAVPAKLSRYGNITLRILIALIIGLGIALRLVLYFQNRNLIIDEANIVRNLAERGFAGLALPLKYEQYAPPVFLWMEKGASLLFGYSEKAMRLYPLLCGIAALAVFYKVAAKLMRGEAIWLPLALFAFGDFFLKYSTELKQYMPDALIALTLIWLALKWDIGQMRKGRFVLYWIVAGSLAIWSSMPSVFILTGIGCYYAWPALREKKYGSFIQLLPVAGAWILQFGLYYLAILKPQINSEYLQNYHREYFLFATPESHEEWLHNWNRIEAILQNVGGVTTVAIVTNLTLLLIGGITLARKRTAQFMLIALPVGLVLIAAALKQFSLIERVVLFMMPLWMLLIGIGFDTLWRLPVPVKGMLVVLGGFIIYSYNGFHFIRQPLRFHEITEGMAYIRGKGAARSQVYVHDANVPTYIYYTGLHPDKAEWASISGAHRLNWDDDYTQVTKRIRDTAYFLYTGGFPDGERARRTKQIEANMRQVAYFEKYICFVYAYVPKATQDTAASAGATPN